MDFETLADYLRHGREVEFRCWGKDYSITNSHYEWHFCCDTDGTSHTLCPYPELERLAEETGRMTIENVPIRQIFDETLGDLAVLDIL